MEEEQQKGMGGKANQGQEWQKHRSEFLFHLIFSPFISFDPSTNISHKNLTACDSRSATTSTLPYLSTAKSRAVRPSCFDGGEKRVERKRNGGDQGE
jgi:hypothetical protein